jgi:hypothetical protein
VEYIWDIGGKVRKKEKLGPRRRCVDIIKLNLGEIRWGGMDCIHFALDRNQWRALVNTIMKPQVP